MPDRTMIERVAMAIFFEGRGVAESDQPAIWATMPDGDETVSARGYLFGRDSVRARARAAFAAMRDPPWSIVEAGQWPAEDDGARACWHAMIDAILAEAATVENR